MNDERHIINPATAGSGVSRRLLSDRLKEFVRYGVLRRVRYRQAPRATNAS